MNNHLNQGTGNPQNDPLGNKLTNGFIKESNANDFNDIMRVEELAFGTKKEARLSAELLQDNSARPYLSLLAFDGDKAVGHILYTRVCIAGIGIDQPLMHILAPLAVIPEYQRRGIGGTLIEEGLRRLKVMGSETVFVLGHIGYYDRFGFIPDAGGQGYEPPFPIPEEFKDAWMVQSLSSSHLSTAGLVKCADALNKEEHWRE